MKILVTLATSGVGRQLALLYLTRPFWLKAAQQMVQA